MKAAVTFPLSATLHPCPPSFHYCNSTLLSFCIPLVLSSFLEWESSHWSFSKKRRISLLSPKSRLFLFPSSSFHPRRDLHPSSSSSFTLFQIQHFSPLPLHSPLSLLLVPRVYCPSGRVLGSVLRELLSGKEYNPSLFCMSRLLQALG